MREQHQVSPQPTDSQLAATTPSTWYMLLPWKTLQPTSRMQNLSVSEVMAEHSHMERLAQKFGRREEADLCGWCHAFRTDIAVWFIWYVCVAILPFPFLPCTLSLSRGWHVRQTAAEIIGDYH